MEDVLDLYAEPYDSQRPVVCFDETSTQLLADTRPPLPAQPGLPQRQDYHLSKKSTPLKTSSGLGVRTIKTPALKPRGLERRGRLTRHTDLSRTSTR